jgi:hypothetical protein
MGSHPHDFCIAAKARAAASAQFSALYGATVHLFLYFNNAPAQLAFTMARA